MENNEVNLRAVETITDKPVTFTAKILDRKPKELSKFYYLENLLVFLGIKKKRVEPEEPTEREFTIRRAVVGNMYRIGARAQNIPDNILQSSLSKLVVEGSYLYMNDFIYIAACGIQNNRDEPTEELLDFIRWNFEMEDIFGVCDMILSRFNFKAFIDTTVLIKGADVLSVEEPDAKNAAEPETDKTGQLAEEIIARGQL